MAHPGGRPMKFKSPEELNKLITNYYDNCEKKKKPLTYAGLSYALGMDRQTFYNYAKRDEFFDIIKDARERVQAYVEEQLIERGNAGTIFYSKNYGYTDRQEVSVEHSNFSETLDKFVKKL